ncbi:MAG: T9SS type A sorting domain-containing protein, partial [Candidatus Symbiothrix sp.]|nr:T9SS type A sorting domain-containing protein [Candidatus Symbiothrix sp.]
TPNTAWIKDAQGRWTPSNQYTPQPVSTSLAIQALLSYDEGYSVPSLDTNASRSIRYLRDEHRLLLPENSCGTGAIQIYSIHGKLLESIPVIQQQKSVFIRSLSERTVYIVRLVRGQKVYTNKFIY